MAKAFGYSRMWGGDHDGAAGIHGLTGPWEIIGNNPRGLLLKDFFCFRQKTIFLFDVAIEYPLYFGRRDSSLLEIF